MTGGNMDAFLASLEAVQRGDWEAFIAAMDPQIEWIPQRAPMQGAYVGHADVRRFAADTRETFELFRPEYDDIRDFGDQIVAIGRLRIRGRGSQIETEVPSAIVIDYRDGLAVRFKDYVEPEAALAAVESPD